MFNRQLLLDPENWRQNKQINVLIKNLTQNLRRNRKGATI